MTSYDDELYGIEQNHSCSTDLSTAESSQAIFSRSRKCQSLCDHAVWGSISPESDIEPICGLM